MKDVYWMMEVIYFLVSKERYDFNDELFVSKFLLFYFQNGEILLWDEHEFIKKSYKDR